MRSLIFPPCSVPVLFAGMSGIVLKRFLLLVGILVLLSGGLYWYYSSYCLSMAHNAIFQQDLLTASKWIERGEATKFMRPEFAFIRARLYRKKSRFPEMSRQLNLAKSLGYDAQLLKREQWLAYAQAGRMEQLEKHLSELLQAGDDLSEICDAYVRGCVLQYRIDDAYQLIGIWEADLPQDPQPHFLKGRLLEHGSDLESAENEFRTAIELSPRHAAASYNLARILISKQKYEESLQYYKKTNEIMEIKQPGLIGIAECNIQLQKFEEARKTLELCRKEDPNLLKNAYRYLGDPAVQAKAKFFAVYGQLELALENYPEAIRHFELALEQNSYDWRSRYSYSLALSQAGRKQEARVEAEKVARSKNALASCDVLIDKLRTNPADVEVRLQVGIIILEHVSEYQGLTWIKSVLKYEPNHEATLKLLKEHGQLPVPQ